MNTHGLLKLAALAVGLAAATAGWSQSWPSKPVRIIVPFAPGGGTDIQGRLLGRKFYESMGQTFVVDNRSGASGLIGAELAAKSPPDGYTLLFTTASLAVNLTLYGARVKFDAFKDLAPVSWISSVPLVLAVHPSVPAKSPRELVALAKRSKLTPGNNGAGTTSHLSVEMLNHYAGLNLPIVSYKGGGPAMTALISGEVDFVFGTALTVAPHVKSGRIRGLAVTTAKKSSTFPDLPTMASLYPGFESDNWYAMFFPAGTSRDIIARMHAEILKGLKSPDVAEFMSKEGADPVGSTPEELTAYFRKEVEKYARLIKARNIKLD